MHIKLIKLIEKSYTSRISTSLLPINKEDLTRICYLLISFGLFYIVILLGMLLQSDKEPEMVSMYLLTSFATFLALLWFVRGGSYKLPSGKGGELNAPSTTKTEKYKIAEGVPSIKNINEELDKIGHDKIEIERGIEI